MNLQKKTRAYRLRLRVGAALFAAVAVGAGALATTAAEAAQPAKWMYAGDFAHASIPTLGNLYLNDHSVIRDGSTWHLFSIQGQTPTVPGTAPDSALETKLLHATSSSLNGPWNIVSLDAMPIDPSYGASSTTSGEKHLWAPYVMKACTNMFVSTAPRPCTGGFGEKGKFYMFYAAGDADPSKAAINLATADSLNGPWTREPSGPLLRDGYEARDPYVTWTGSEWRMYYTATKYNSGGLNTVASVASANLVNWTDTSNPDEVFKDVTATAGTPRHEPLTESPVVIKRNNVWYLLIGPRGGGYTGTDVYWSTTPNQFSIDNYAGHIDAHAPEIVTDDSGKDWVTSAGWWQAGLDVAPVEWSDAARPWQGMNPVAVGRNQDKRLEVFAISPDGATIDNRYQKANGEWSGWNEGSTTGAFGPNGAATVPSVGKNKDGRLEVFALDRNNYSIAHRWQLAPSGGWVNQWEGGFGPTAAGGAPAVAANLDGRLEVVAAGPGGANVSHRWQDANMKWPTPWDVLVNQPVAAPPVMERDGAGKLHVIAAAPGFQSIVETVQQAANQPFATTWSTIGDTAAGSPPVLAAGDNHALMVLAVTKPYGGGVAFRANVNGNWLGWNGSDGVFTGSVTAVPEGNNVRLYATGPSRVPGSVHNFTRTLLISANGAAGAWENVSGGQNSGCAPSGGLGVNDVRWAFNLDASTTPAISSGNGGFGSWSPAGPAGGSPCGQPTHP